MDCFKSLLVAATITTASCSPEVSNPTNQNEGQFLATDLAYEGERTFYRLEKV